MDVLSEYLSSHPLALAAFFVVLGVATAFGAETLAETQVKFGANANTYAFQMWVARAVGVAFIVIGLVKLGAFIAGL